MASVTLEVPCSEREFNVFKQNADSVKAVEIHIKRHSTIPRFPRELDGTRDKEWMGCRHHMVHVHQAMQMNNDWQRIIFDWSAQPRPYSYSIGEILYARDISLALRYCRSSVKSVAFNNLRIDGTRTEIAELTKELAYAKDSIAFVDVIDESEEMKLLMWACIETRSVFLKNCPWAEEHLNALNLSSCLERLHLYSIKQRHLDGIVGYLRYAGWPCESRHGLKRLNIRYMTVDDDQDEKNELEDLSYDLADALRTNTKLEGLSYPIGCIHDSFRVLIACRVNRTLKDVNFHVCFSLNPPDNPTEKELERLEEIVLSVVKTNSVIQSITFTNHIGDVVLELSPEAQYYLKFNKEVRPTLLPNFGNNDDDWLGALIKTAAKADKSMSFFLLNNNPAAYASAFSDSLCTGADDGSGGGDSCKRQCLESIADEE
jgi:hypothetical protein